MHCLLQGICILVSSGLGGFIIELVVRKIMHPTPNSNRTEDWFGLVFGVLFGGMLLMPLATLLIVALFECLKFITSLLILCCMSIFSLLSKCRNSISSLLSACHNVGSPCLHCRLKRSHHYQLIWPRMIHRWCNLKSGITISPDLEIDLCNILF